MLAESQGGRPHRIAVAMSEHRRARETQLADILRAQARKGRQCARGWRVWTVWRHPIDRRWCLRSPVHGTYWDLKILQSPFPPGRPVRRGQSRKQQVDLGYDWWDAPTCYEPGLSAWWTPGAARRYCREADTIHVLGRVTVSIPF